MHTMGGNFQLLRQSTTPFPSPDQVLELDREETHTRDLEIQDAQRLRKHRRERWLKLGEAPSYFFNQLKSKQSRESIKILKLPNGEHTEDELEIMEEIHSFYSGLFRNCGVDQERDLRNDALNVLHNTITDDENRQILETPSEMKIDKIISELHREKSPGLDGVTTKILQHGWSYMKDGYYAMIIASLLKAIRV